jgi:hypothetical protein
MAFLSHVLVVAVLVICVFSTPVEKSDREIEKKDNEAVEKRSSKCQNN